MEMELFQLIGESLNVGGNVAAIAIAIFLYKLDKRVTVLEIHQGITK